MDQPSNKDRIMHRSRCLSLRALAQVSRARRSFQLDLLDREVVSQCFQRIRVYNHVSSIFKGNRFRRGKGSGIGVFSRIKDWEGRN